MRVVGSCIGRGWRICRIGARWVGIVVVVVVVVAVRTAVVVVAAAAAGIGACQSVEEPFAVAAAVVASVAAFAAEAFQSAAHPSVFARMDFVWRFVGSSDCSVAAAC